MGGWGCKTGRSGPRLRRRADQGKIALSLVALLYKAASAVRMVPGRSAWEGVVCWGYRPSFLFLFYFLIFS